jgi:predicted nuclease of restriction endonuclease-like (RecB) superfamily
MADLKNNDYKEWILEIKNRIYSVQAKASIAVNSAVIEFYFFLGKSLSEKENIWGSKLLEQISLDLKIEFPDMKGFSVSNLKYCKNFYLFYADIISQQAVDQFIKQMVFQIPWGHNILIFTKSKDTDEALFYLNQTKQNNWGRDILAFQIKSDLYNRSGKALTNFKNTLPEHLSDLAQETFKDPYNFDFMCMSKPYI